MEIIATQLWKVSSETPDPEVILQAAAIIKRGGLVAFPTETVYGLGANGLDSRAVTGIYRAKGRPADNPLILHIANPNQVDKLSSPTAVARQLMEKFWPGPLTLVLPKIGNIPTEVTGGLDTVAVRMPNHPVALALIEAAGVPVAAPSANSSGRPSPTTANHVLGDLEGRIDAILDGGPAGMGLESTVLDLTSEIPIILRPGGVTFEQLQDTLGAINIDPSVLGEKLPENRAPRSPGMKYLHYAPAAKVILFEGECALISRAIRERAEELTRKGIRVGILATKENVASYPDGAIILEMGSRKKPLEAASVLFGHLRDFDRLEVDVIFAEGLETKGMGLAVMNRLRRAAGEVIQLGVQPKEY